MIALRGKIMEAVRSKNPNIDDATASEAVDDFVESVGKIRTLMAPSQQIIERDITQQHQDQRQDARMADADQRQDKSIKAAGDRQDKSINAAGERQDKSLGASAARQTQRLAQSSQQFQQREQDINQRLQTRQGQTQQNVAIRGMVQRIKADRQRVVDQMNAYRTQKGGVITDDDPQWKKYTQALDVVDASMARIQKAVGGKSGASAGGGGETKSPPPFPAKTEGQTATSPNGDKWVVKGGQWVEQ